MPQPDHPIQPASPAPEAPQGRRLLGELRARAQAGPPPSPAEMASALAQARARVAALAAGLAGANEAGLAAYEEALLLCMDLTMLGLDLARAHGPAYLPLPGQPL
ncbi:MAG: hypothetical protein HY910_09050 [Desulfarculus sp.]|nr:hypothetical protein [Desulfarculus sp.]